MNSVVTPGGQVLRRFVTWKWDPPYTDTLRNDPQGTPYVVLRAHCKTGIGAARLMLTVTLPAALPGILGGAKIGWTFALRSLMAGELLFVSGGLGQLLETGRDLGDTSLVLAVVVVIIALGRAREVLLFSRIDRVIARRWGVEEV